MTHAGSCARCCAPPAACRALAACGGGGTALPDGGSATRYHCSGPSGTASCATWWCSRRTRVPQAAAGLQDARPGAARAPTRPCTPRCGGATSSTTHRSTSSKSLERAGSAFVLRPVRPLVVAAWSATSPARGALPARVRRDDGTDAGPEGLARRSSARPLRGRAPAAPHDPTALRSRRACPGVRLRMSLTTCG